MNTILKNSLFLIVLMGFFPAALIIMPAYASSGNNQLKRNKTLNQYQQPVQNIVQNTAYNGIQNALDDANPGDVLIVAAGIYKEALTVKHSVTILGPNHNISPNVAHSERLPDAVLQPQGGADAIRIFSDNVHLTLKGVIIDMSESNPNDRYLTLENDRQKVVLHFENNIFRYAQRVGTRGNASWFFNKVSFNLYLNNNLFYHNAPSNGIFIHDDFLGDHVARVTITNNVWKNNGAWAMNLHNVYGSISGNVIMGDGYSPEQWEGWLTMPGDPDWPGPFGIVLANHNNDLNIINNQFVDLYGPGIRIWNSFKGNLSVTGNEFTDNRVAAVNVNPVDWQGSLDNVVFRDNTFNGNEMAFDNPSDYYLDARYNNWLYPTGPNHHVLNVSGQGDAISNNVLFTPWWHYPATDRLIPEKVYSLGGEFNEQQSERKLYGKAITGHEVIQNDNEEYQGHGLKIFPNPVRSGRINIALKGEHSADVKLYVYDVRGYLINLKAPCSIDGVFNMDVSNLPTGIYYVRVVGDYYVLAEKFVISD